MPSLIMPIVQHPHQGERRRHPRASCSTPLPHCRPTDILQRRSHSVPAHPTGQATWLPLVCRRAWRNIQFWAIFSPVRTTHHSASLALVEGPSRMVCQWDAELASLRWVTQQTRWCPKGDAACRCSCVTRTSQRAFPLMTLTDLTCLFLFRSFLLRRCFYFSLCLFLD